MGRILGLVRWGGGGKKKTGSSLSLKEHGCPQAISQSGRTMLWITVCIAGLFQAGQLHGTRQKVGDVGFLAVSKGPVKPHHSTGRKKGHWFLKLPRLSLGFRENSKSREKPYQFWGKQVAVEGLWSQNSLGVSGVGSRVRPQQPGNWGGPLIYYRLTWVKPEQVAHCQR